MTRRRHTPDQIIRKLAEGNKRLAGGAELDEVARHLEIAESTWHRWVGQYGGMKASDAKRPKELVGENAPHSTWTTQSGPLMDIWPWPFLWGTPPAPLDHGVRGRGRGCRHRAIRSSSAWLAASRYATTLTAPPYIPVPQVKPTMPGF